MFPNVQATEIPLARSISVMLKLNAKAAFASEPHNDTSRLDHISVSMMPVYCELRILIWGAQWISLWIHRYLHNASLHPMKCSRMWQKRIYELLIKLLGHWNWYQLIASMTIAVVWPPFNTRTLDPVGNKSSSLWLHQTPNFEDTAGCRNSAF